MLKTVRLSHAKKTAGCAVTYRAGSHSCYGTCPASCQLNPEPSASVQTVDRQYFKALLQAVPIGGYSFTYTHFHPTLWATDYLNRLGTGKPTTVVNYSADTVGQAIAAYHRWLPTVIALPKGTERRVQRVGDVRLVRCPAEYQNVICATCGGSEGPLCARPHRDYVVAFYGHGSGARYVGAPVQAGCYASSGNVRFHWDATVGKARKSEARQLVEFTRQLPRGATLRHHVAGDIGEES